MNRVDCTICGFEIDTLDIEETRRGPIHADRQCPTGAVPKKTSKPRTARKSPERVLAEGAGLVREIPLTLRQFQHAGTSHTNCEHPATKAARSACRRLRNAG